MHYVEDGLFRAVAVLRAVLLLNAVGVDVVEIVGGGARGERVDHPVAVVACLVLMAGWTLAATYLYGSHARRGRLLLGADLGLAVGLVLLSPLVKGPGFGATVPGFWVMAAMLAWAVHLRWPGGLVAAVALAGADVAVRDVWTQSIYGNVFLLLIGGPVVGYLSGLLQQLAADRDRAERAAAVAAERARLARAVHDGVLQVLGLVQRRARELGPDGAELARVAGEQEQGLRSLIRAQDSLADRAGGTADLVEHVVRLGARAGAEVAAPAGAVVLDAERVTELTAVLAACLDNVARHVGADAPAWVLLEDLGADVALSVRDEGPGIPAGRLDEAVGQGRLGVSHSIRGRVADLGGTAVLDTGAEGTEWSIVVPKERP